MRICLTAFLLAVLCFQASALVLPPERGETPLMLLCRSGSATEVKALIDSGADVNARSQYYRRTALYYALDNPAPAAIVNLLLDHGADPALMPELLNTAVSKLDYREKREQYETIVLRLLDYKAAWDFDSAWQRVLSSRNPALFNKLIKCGADVNSRLDLSPPLIQAVSRGNPVAVKCLLDNGADPNIYNYENIPAICYSTDNEMLALMLKAGAPPEDFLKFKRQYSSNPWPGWINLSLLNRIAGPGCVIVEKDLLIAASNPNLPAIYETLIKMYPEKVPLDAMAAEAARHACIDNFEFLKKQGANTSFVSDLLYLQGISNVYRSDNPDKLKILQYLVENKCDLNATDPESGRTALMLTLHVIPQYSVTEFLLKNGADPKLRSKSGGTALMYLCASSSFSQEKSAIRELELLKSLLRGGADINAADDAGYTPLFIALRQQKSPELIKALVWAGADVNRAVNDVSPLMLAAALYPADIAEILISRGAKLDVRDNFNWTPLFYAALHFPDSESACVISFKPRHRKQDDAGKTIALLLKHGADIGLHDKNKVSPFVYAAAWADSTTLKTLYDKLDQKSLDTALAYAAKHNKNLDAVEFLLDKGAEPNIALKSETTDRSRCSAPPEDKSNSDFKAYYDIFGSRPDYFRELPAPPLFSAVFRRDIPLIKLLLNKGADPNFYYRDHSGGTKPNTILDSYRLCPEVEDLLFEAGLNCADKYRRSVEIFAYLCGESELSEIKEKYRELAEVPLENFPEELQRALHNAAARNTFEVFEFVRSLPGVKITIGTLISAASNEGTSQAAFAILKLQPKAIRYVNNSGNNLLSYASTPELVRYLVKNGVDVNHKNQDGKTPLQARMGRRNHGWNDPAGELIKAFAECGADLNVNGEDGNPLIFQALKSWSPSFLRCLLAHGANVNVTNKNGKTPLEVAVADKNLQAFEVLLAHGADFSKIKSDNPYITRRLAELAQKKSAGKHVPGRP